MRVRRVLVVALAVLGLAVGVQAQTPAPSPAPPPVLSNFSLTGSAVGFLGSGVGSQPASLAGVWYQTTNRVSFGFETIQIPSFSSWYLGMVQYSVPLNSLLGKKVSSRLKFDPSQVSVGFQGGLGKMQQSATAAQVANPVNRFAETVGVVVSFPLNSHLDFQAVSAQWLHSGVQRGFIITPSTTALATGFSLNIGGR